MSVLTTSCESMPTRAPLYARQFCTKSAQTAPKSPKTAPDAPTQTQSAMKMADSAEPHSPLVK